VNINDITGTIVDRAMMIHQRLGPRLLESVYHRILDFELRKAGLTVKKEVAIPVEWDGHVIDESFRADLIVESLVLVELKSMEATSAVHRKQLLTYLKLTHLRVGLLINFGSAYLKDDIHRMANNLKE
jgi:iron complex transport system substrate-binding protein